MAKLQIQFSKTRAHSHRDGYFVYGRIAIFHEHANEIGEKYETLTPIFAGKFDIPNLHAVSDQIKQFDRELREEAKRLIDEAELVANLGD